MTILKKGLSCQSFRPRLAAEFLNDPIKSELGSWILRNESGEIPIMAADGIAIGRIGPR